MTVTTKGRALVRVGWIMGGRGRGRRGVVSESAITQLIKAQLKGIKRGRYEAISHRSAPILLGLTLMTLRTNNIGREHIRLMIRYIFKRLDDIIIELKFVKWIKIKGMPKVVWRRTPYRH
jgi:hypothetical protein